MGIRLFAMCAPRVLLLGLAGFMVGSLVSSSADSTNARAGASFVSSHTLATTTSNPIDDASVFVRQHYLDFLNRQADSSGLAFWTNEVASCNANQACVEAKRINVSAAFFLSIEFQQTGYLVERMYRAAYGTGTGTSTFGGAHQLPIPIVRLSEFLPDTQMIGHGVVVGQNGWEMVLENNKQSFTSLFVQRSRFTTAFPVTMTPAQFVDALNANAGSPLSQAERNQLVSDLMAGAKTRAEVLRAVSEDSDLYNAEFNGAFVLMQYFGYLGRNPNDTPDSDYTGYDFWLTKLNNFTQAGDDVLVRVQKAEMVKAFITSGEYRRRFSIPLSANPNPILERLCVGCGGGSTDREAVTNLTIQETSGIAGNVNSIGVTLRDNSSNAVIASGDFDANGVISLAGSNRLLANGSLVAHDIGVHYAQSFAGTPATLTFTVRVTDDNGNPVTTALSAQVTTGWKPQTSGTAEVLLGVSFTDINKGYAVGTNGVIRVTSNGGNTWSSQASGTARFLRDVYFSDANHGVIVGESGLILRTIDGTTWSQQTSGTVQHLVHVHFVNNNVGIATGQGGVILKTTDGGVTWSPQSSGTNVELPGVHMIDVNTAVVVGFGGTIRRTTNGGVSWASVPVSGFTSDLRSVHFFGTTGVAVSIGGRILRSTDGGQSWNNVTSGTTNDLYAVKFRDADTVFAVGTAKILVSTDGGSSWAASTTTSFGGDLYGVTFSSLKGWAVGQNGLILHAEN